MTDEVITLTMKVPEALIGDPQDRDAVARAAGEHFKEAAVRAVNVMFDKKETP